MVFIVMVSGLMVILVSLKLVKVVKVVELCGGNYYCKWRVILNIYWFIKCALRFGKIRE